MNQTKSK